MFNVGEYSLYGNLVSPASVMHLLYFSVLILRIGMAKY